jgi:hypothetical protein
MYNTGVNISTHCKHFLQPKLLDFHSDDVIVLDATELQLKQDRVMMNSFSGSFIIPSS